MGDIGGHRAGETSKDESRVLRARACGQMRESLMMECWTGVVTAGGKSSAWESLTCASLSYSPLSIQLLHVVIL